MVANDAGELGHPRQSATARTSCSCTSSSRPPRSSARTARSSACAPSAPSSTAPATSRAPASSTTGTCRPSTARSATCSHELAQAAVGRAGRHRPHEARPGASTTTGNAPAGDLRHRLDQARPGRPDRPHQGRRQRDGRQSCSTTARPASTAPPQPAPEDAVVAFLERARRPFTTWEGWYRLDAARAGPRRARGPRARQGRRARGHAARVSEPQKIYPRSQEGVVGPSRRERRAVPLSPHRRGMLLHVFDAHVHIIDPAVPAGGERRLPAGAVHHRRLSQAGRRLRRGRRRGGDRVVSRAPTRPTLSPRWQELGPGWVGVTQLAEDATDEDIVALDKAGVRALRFNLRRSATDLKLLATQAQRAWDLVGWHAEFYVDAALLALPGAGVQEAARREHRPSRHVHQRACPTCSTWSTAGRQGEGHRLRPGHHRRRGRRVAPHPRREPRVVDVRHRPARDQGQAAFEAADLD